MIRYTLLYPNEPQDIETVIVDQISNDIYLVQKNWFGTRASIYKVGKIKLNRTRNFHFTYILYLKVALLAFRLSSFNQVKEKPLAILSWKMLE